MLLRLVLKNSIAINIKNINILFLVVVSSCEVLKK